jgi:hypothetical protein
MLQIAVYRDKTLIANIANIPCGQSGKPSDQLSLTVAIPSRVKDKIAAFAVGKSSERYSGEYSWNWKAA